MQANRYPPFSSCMWNSRSPNRDQSISPTCCRDSRPKSNAPNVRNGSKADTYGFNSLRLRWRFRSRLGSKWGVTRTSASDPRGTVQRCRPALCLRACSSRVGVGAPRSSNGERSQSVSKIAASAAARPHKSAVCCPSSGDSESAAKVTNSVPFAARDGSRSAA